MSMDHERTHVVVEHGKARVNFWPLLLGRIAVHDASADLVLVEVSVACTHRPTRSRGSCRDSSASCGPRLHQEPGNRRPSGRRVEFLDASGAGIVASKSIRVFEGNIIYGVCRRVPLVPGAADPMTLSGEATTRMSSKVARVARRRKLRR